MGLSLPPDTLVYISYAAVHDRVGFTDNMLKDYSDIKDNHTAGLDVSDKCSYVLQQCTVVFLRTSSMHQSEG
jgi:hypothetical protein